MSRGRQIATSLGPTNHPKCPECGNSFGNAIPDGSPTCLRCADCKLVFDVPDIYFFLSHEIADLRTENERLRSACEAAEKVMGRGLLAIHIPYVEALKQLRAALSTGSEGTK